MNLVIRLRLIDAIRNRPPDFDVHINQQILISNQTRQRNDWLWHELLVSMATMGNSRGMKLINDQNIYNRVSYQSLQQVILENRQQTILNALIESIVRRPVQKAEWLFRNYEFIISCGGLANLQTWILLIHGKKSKIKFMRLFDGIGDKYARNIFMDMYDQDFIESIAIDERIKDISELIEIDKLSYDDQENIYIEIAHDSGINPWHLDRLIYFNLPYFLHSLTNPQ